MRSESHSPVPAKRLAPVDLAAARIDLPVELSFLAAYHLDKRLLEGAAYGARRERVCAARTLIAEGAVSETLYYRALAHHLGLPFVDGWPRLAPSCDPGIAFRRGSARLADAEAAAWVVAPSDGAINLLLRARRNADLAWPDIAITTPSHFYDLVQMRARAAIAHAASEALPDAAAHLSAKNAADARVGLIAALCILCCIGGLMTSAHVVVDVLGAIFFASMACRLLVCAEALGGVAPRAPTAVSDAAAPFYTILVPLHREAGMVPDLVEALARLDYPPSKREVLFLLEQDDGATRAALKAHALPPGFRVIVVPDGAPRTKPRALNVGLLLAKGDLVTVYDAEDRPEPDQLRKAAAAFANAPPAVACVQARLAIANSTSGLLPCLFAIAYAALFDLFNVGLGLRGLPMALGGTSNHFRTSVLRSTGGWDAYNVTEDADLGLRLARFGYAVRTLESTTWEAAVESLPDWLKQRRRWTKGWIQTLIVLASDPGARRDFGPWKSAFVALLLTHLVTGPLLTPFVLAIMAWHLRAGFPVPHGAMEIAEATSAVAVFALGIVSTLWCGYVGVRMRRVAGGLAALPWLLPYQLLISIAAWCGLWDLVRSPYHWHKTEHGAARARPRRRWLSGVSAEAAASSGARRQAH